MNNKTSLLVNKKPPSSSKNILSDIKYFLINKPQKQTLIRFESEENRNEYNQRVRQRVGIDVNKNSILNIHQIGVDAPVSYVFNELLNWNGDSTCWPNHIAKVERIDNKIEKIRILTFGWSKYPFKFMKSFCGLDLIPLFNLTSIRIKRVPDEFDFDNARYLLYKCSGGYPIGIFTMYVRSSIAELGETAQAQLVFAVSFNFYGKEKEAHKLVNRMWESIHNRVTSNVMTRVKQLSEWRIDKIQNSYEYL
ncbi:MAG: hypothetical protein HQ522_07560 [Bacteroidetes bacterium]|nr:hypothetical protein [Bacteroidota bacterium]